MTRHRWRQLALHRLLSIHWVWSLGAILGGKAGQRWPNHILVARIRNHIHRAAAEHGYRDAFSIQHRGASLRLPLLDEGWAELYFRGQSRPPAYLYEPELFDFAESWLRPGDCVFDVGANVGLFTLFCAHLVKAGSVIAFEPNPEIVPLLRTNCSLQRTDAAVAIAEMAVGNMVGPTTLALPGWVTNQGTASLRGFSPLSDSARTCETRMTTIDRFVAANSTKAIRLLKADVEGAELLVIEGASGALGHGMIDAVVLEFNRDILSDPERTWTSWSERLRPAGYDPFSLGAESLVPEVGPPSARISNVVWKRHQAP